MPFLQMHTVVAPPLTSDARGRISCRPIGHEPIAFEWTGPRGEPVRVDESGSEACDVVPGRYRVDAVDASGARADVVLDVEPALPAAVVVREYRVTPASTSGAHDGSVAAVGSGLDGWSFLWTQGARTDGPVLRDVPCGVYAAVAVPRAADGAAPTFVHTCAPARVDVVAAGGRWGDGGWAGAGDEGKK
jgi:hypothetical protein